MSQITETTGSAVFANIVNVLTENQVVLDRDQVVAHQVFDNIAKTLFSGGVVLDRSECIVLHKRSFD